MAATATKAWDERQRDLGMREVREPEQAARQQDRDHRSVASLDRPLHVAAEPRLLEIGRAHV